MVTPVRSSARPAASRGFTLLEVMVAVAILGLALTVILSAQAGLYTSSGYAQHVSTATGLARCKMTELEERLLKLGYPYADETDEGACCADDSRSDFKCEWKIERIELPQPTLDSGMDGGAGGLGKLASAMSSAGVPGGAPGAIPTSGAGPLGALAQLGVNPGSIAGDGGISAMGSALSASTMGGTEALAPLVMGFVYPSLKPMLEESIRKVTVSVTWREGIRSRDLELVQYVTNPMKVASMPGLMGSASPFGLPPAGGALPAGTTSPATPLTPSGVAR